MGFGQRAGKFNELGKVISIRPSSGTPMTAVQSFQIQSSGQPASVIHARDPIFKPGTETPLESDALFFMPTESYGADGIPQYTQLVINDGFSNPLKVSEYNEYFTITKPGTMGAAISSIRRSSDVGFTIAPKAITIPQTYRREGLVEVFLTTSSDADAEVAYSDDGINWCSLSIMDIFRNSSGGAYAVATKFQNFPKYLVGANATRLATLRPNVTIDASYRIEATGSTSYNTSGIYRSKVVPFLRDQSGTQYFLKTNVTFTGASVNSSASENGTISGTLGGASEGYNEHTAGTAPVYTATPVISSDPSVQRHVVSFTVNGSAVSISNPAIAQQHTFTNISGGNSIQAVFGYKTVASKTGSGTISPTGDIYKAEGDSIDFTFSTTPTSITYNGVAQTVDGTTFTLGGIGANADFVVAF